jgi:anti-sigma factor RsiW
MFEFLRNLTKTDQEKRQDFLTAYLDDGLSPRDRRRFEQWLESNDALRTDLEQQRIIKEAISQLPRVKAPRSFTLDPSLYGRPSSQFGLQLYPAMRIATVLALFVFITLLSIDVFVSESGLSTTITGADELAQVTEKVSEEAGAAERDSAESEEQSQRSEVMGEVVAAAPAAEVTAEEVAELEEAVLESESIEAPEQPTGTFVAQESAPAADEPSEERAGEIEFFAPADAQAEGASGTENEARAAALSAVQTVVATQERDDQVQGEVRKTNEVEALDGESTRQPAVVTPTVREMSEPTPVTAEAIAAEESTANYLQEVPDGVQEVIEEETSETLRYVDEGPAFGLGSLRLAQILLGLSVIFLILLTLLLRRRVQKGP